MGLLKGHIKVVEGFSLSSKNLSIIKGKLNLISAIAKGQSWSAKTPMPTARYALTSSAVNNIIYVIGGYDVNGNIVAVNEAYDPSLDI